MANNSYSWISIVAALPSDLMPLMAFCQSHFDSWKAAFYLFFLFHGLPGHLNDGFGDIVSLLGADFEPLDMIFLQEFDLLLRNASLFGFIALVDETVDPIFRRVLPGLFHPVTDHVFKGFGVADVVDEDDGICSFVVRLGNSSEPLLPRCIPNLKFDIVIIDMHGSAWQDCYLNRKSMPMVEM